jgi:hypothetical protein
MQPNTFCFNFKPLSKNRYSKGMCCLHLAAKLSLIDPIVRKEFFFRETVYSWILCNMARYYYRNILLTSAAYLTKTYIRRVKYVYISYMFISFHKHAISPVHLNRGWLFLIKDMFKHIDRNHKFAFYLSCENSHDTLQKYWYA